MAFNKKFHSSITIILMFASTILLLISLPIVMASKPLGNPYNILGLTRHASSQEIRKAYKNLVKEWHPDKTNHPGAENKFVEITKAYEILSDPERRRNFDMHGITEEGLFRDKRNANHFNMPDQFEELFSNNFKFHYQSRDISLFHKMSISHRSFENINLPKSYFSPHIILFYSDWCFACLQVEPTWRKLIDELEPLGVHFITIHAGRENTLTKKLNVHSLPSIATLIDGKTSIYRESMLSVPKIIDFFRSRFPYKLIYNVNDKNAESFLSGWSDNKIRAIVFDKKETPRLRYLIMALSFRDRVVFGYVETNKLETSKILEKYKISEDVNTLLLFNEYTDKPVATISMKDIPSDTMRNVISSNKFLILPRLSNQAILDSICPPEWQRPQKRLCAILVSQNNQIHDLARHKFRQAALTSPYSFEKVRYTYIFKESQPEFLSALTVGEGSPLDPSLHIVIIWRRDSSHLEYQWLPHDWSKTVENDSQWNETRKSLEETIKNLLHSSEALLHVAQIGELKDEHALNMIDKLISRAIGAFEYILDQLTREQILTFLSVLVTLLVIAAAGYGMSYLVKLEEASIQSKHGQFKDSKNTTIQPQLRLHEMRAEKYNALVRLLKPGCRTIVLLVDNQSKFKLLPAFHKAVWPYRKNKTLLFSHLSLERGLDWYKKLLSLSLPEPRELNINAKNCVGTVLSLNGHRKYFCMYHAKHPETKKGINSRRIEKMTKRLARPQDPETGAFIGFDETSSDSELSQDEMHSKVLYQENLLDGLPMWLDRLFEGTTQRYYINYWPDFTAK